MAVELNHTIVGCRDKKESAAFVAEILGLEVAPDFGPFVPVQTGNGVTLDFADREAEAIVAQHYAFLVSEEEFDGIFGRIQEAGIPYYADPHHEEAGRINHHDGGRGVYFDDLNGHVFEAITRPYGSR
jgi:catechol 2,3-dioxygenase-like lactoylglutathione lyase family enzyme